MSICRFGVRHPVPVNLLLMTTLVVGVYSGLSLRREFFPEVDPEQVMVTLPYPGATAEEIEQTLAIKIEDKLAQLDEVKTLTTTLSEGGGGIMVKFREGIDVDKAVDEVERAIDALTDLPVESEEIRVTLFESRMPVIRVSLFGDLEEVVRKRGIRAVRDDLRTLPGMGEILIAGVRDDEFRVDVHRDALVEYGIRLSTIASVIRSEMFDGPGGTVRSEMGDIKVRTLGVEEHARLIREIELRSSRDGATVRLEDIAKVSETFVDEQLLIRVNGKPAAALTVFAVGDQDIVQIAEMVRAYVAGRNGESFYPTVSERLRSLVMRGKDTLRKQAWKLGINSHLPLPVGASLTTNTDLARFVEGRLELLIRNATYGAILVFATLLLILNWRVAVWVGVGLVVAICGTLLLMYWIGITLNLLTMFGLIVVLGLLVDDAIVVSENIQARHDRGEPTMDAAIKGAEQVLWPVVATVLTSVVAFLPLMFIKGQIGDLLGALPMVVACALFMSLIESLMILPSHMGHSLEHMDRALPGPLARKLERYETKRDRFIFERVIPQYARILERAMRYRYVALAITLAVLIGSVGMIAGGHVPFVFLPSNDSETIIIDLRMPIGTSIARTNAVVEKIEAAAVAQDETISITAVIGQSDNIDTGQTNAAATHIAQMFIELIYVEDRDRNSQAVIASIRKAVADDLNEVERISFSEVHGGSTGPDISVEFRGKDDRRISDVAERFKAMLRKYEGVADIADNNDTGQIELQFELRPGARALGLTRAEIAQQIRASLYGIDAHVFAANQEDIDVRVRLDEQSRHSLYAVENGWLITPTGAAVPLSEVVTVREELTYATIKRIDRERAILVTADTLPGYSPETIFQDLDIDSLRDAFPDITISYAGRQEQMADAFGSLPYGFAAAIFLIYIILAWLFSNYFQPLVVLTAVPFAIVGVIWGHWLLGFEMTFLSMIGFVALSGIVVNDSLILVQFFNEQRRAGKNTHDSLLVAGRARLRPILMTTITTVLGLTPLILEQSFQAHFLIPMAISIAAGLISATVLILLVLPCLIMVLDDMKRLIYLLWFGKRLDEPEPN